MENEPVHTLEIHSLLNGAPVTLVMVLGKPDVLGAVLYRGIDIFPVLDSATVEKMQALGRDVVLDFVSEN